MASSSGARINTPISAYNALNALNDVNRQLGTHQLRLATGKRINSVGDDPSGYTIAKQMEARSAMMSAAVNNVGDAQTMMSTAEQALQTIRDLFTTIQGKQVAASNPAADSTAISNDVNQLKTEIDDIVNNTNFNGKSLFSGAAFQATYAIDDNGGHMTISFDAHSATFATVSSATVASTSFSTNISTIESALQAIGSYMQRLDAKTTNLNTAITNIEASKSRIYDADIAKEQLESSKLQILQQTSVTELSQANASSQVFLTLFR
jgi:flagellin